MTNPLYPDPDPAAERRLATAPGEGKLAPDARRAVIAAWIGTLIEWYDYALYGAAAALVIGPLFFPQGDPVNEQIAAFATFAVGFVARPLGGFIISHLGDRIGRKPAMLLTIILMAVATVVMGLLPTSADIGVWAPVMLVLFRLIQGFGAGAELAGALTLVSEYTPQSRRGFFIGFVTTGAPGGAFLATLAFTFASMLPGDVLLAWAWRIPFLISAVLFFVALWIRNRLEETPAYAAAVEAREGAARASRVPLGEVFAKSPRQLLAGFMSVTGHNVVYYVLSAFALGYLTKTVGMPRHEALIAVLVASFIAAVIIPFTGMIADRVSIRRMVMFGGLAGAVLAYPLFLSLQSGNMWLAMLGMSAAGIFAMGATSPGTSTFLPNLFPTRYRFTGVAAARELNGAIVAGPTPMIATALIAAAGGGIGLVSAFVAVAALLTSASVFVAGTSGEAAPAEDAEAQRAVEQEVVAG